MSKVIIIEDHPDIREIISIHLQNEGHEVFEASNGVKGLELINLEAPQIVILDIMMPELNGYDVCKKLRQDPQSKNIYVIMLSAKDKSQDKITGLDIGADAYLTKPFEIEELTAQVRVGERTVAQKGEVEKDFLTGVYSRRVFKKTLERELYKSKQNKTSLALAKIDIDNFSKYIKLFGLKWGEKALLALTGLMSELSQKEEIIIRWSNDSFIWILPKTDLNWILTLTEDLRGRVNSCSFLERGEITTSIGLAISEENETVTSFCSKVEEALKSAKDQGGNKNEIGYNFNEF